MPRAQTTEDPVERSYRIARYTGPLHRDGKPYLLEYRSPEGTVMRALAERGGELEGWSTWSRFGQLEIARDSAQRQKQRKEYRGLEFRIFDTRTGEEA